MTHRTRRLALGLSFAALLLASSESATADQVVYFINGKAIMVKTVEKGEKFTTLEMEGGGRMGVPNEQIVRIEEYIVSPPPMIAVPVAQAPQPPAVPTPVAELAGADRPAIPPTPGNAPLAAPLPVGPGVGGKVNEGMTAMRPLDINGGDGSAGRAVRPGPGTGGAMAPYNRQAVQRPGLGRRTAGTMGPGGRRSAQGRLGRFEPAPPTAAPAEGAAPAPAVDPQAAPEASPPTETNAPAPEPEPVPPPEGEEDQPR